MSRVGGEGRTVARIVLAIVALVILGAAGGLLVGFVPTNVGYALAIGVIPFTILLIAFFRNPILGVFLVYFLEYFRPQDVLPAIAPLRLPAMFTIFIFLTIVVRVIRSPERKIVWPAQSWVYLALLFVMGISVIIAQNNYWAFWHFRVVLFLVILFFSTINLVESPDQLRKLLVLLVLVHVWLCFRGIQGYLEGNVWGTTGRVGSGFLGDENDFALALVVIFPFAFFAMTALRRWGARWLAFLASLLILITIVLTMSRGGFIGIAVTLFFCWYRGKRKLLTGAILILLIAAVAVIAPSRYFDEIRSIRETDEGTAHKRREYWLAGFRMFAEYPLIGVGPGNSNLRMPQYVDLANPATQWGKAMHGTIPLIAAEMGILGLAIYTILFVQSLLELRRMRRIRVRDPSVRRLVDYFGNALFASILGFLVAATFLSALYYPHIYVLTAFCVVGRRLAVEAGEKEGEE
jgi:O-antigen ligase